MIEISLHRAVSGEAAEGSFREQDKEEEKENYIFALATTVRSYHRCGSTVVHSSILFITPRFSCFLTPIAMSVTV